jgi:hypothetical protein
MATFGRESRQVFFQIFWLAGKKENAPGEPGAWLAGI